VAQPVEHDLRDGFLPLDRLIARLVADRRGKAVEIARIGGRASVGLASAFDGIGGPAPADMTGVDGYPALFVELARRGWSDAELAGLAQGNILRVMARVEAVAAGMAGTPPADAIDRP